MKKLKTEQKTNGGVFKAHEYFWRNFLTTSKMVASKNLLPLGKKLFYACGLFIIGMRKCLPADTTQHTTVWNKSGSSWIWEVSYEFWRVPRRFEKKVPSERQMAVQPPVCFSWHKKMKIPTTNAATSSYLENISSPSGAVLSEFVLPVPFFLRTTVNWVCLACRVSLVESQSTFGKHRRIRPILPGQEEENI